MSELKTIREAQGRIQLELDNASSAKMGTKWWNDRIAALQALIRQEERMMAK